MHRQPVKGRRRYSLLVPIRSIQSVTPQEFSMSSLVAVYPQYHVQLVQSCVSASNGQQGRPVLRSALKEVPQPARHHPWTLPVQWHDQRIHSKVYAGIKLVPPARHAAGAADAELLPPVKGIHLVEEEAGNAGTAPAKGCPLPWVIPLNPRPCAADPGKHDGHPPPLQPCSGMNVRPICPSWHCTRPRVCNPGAASASVGASLSSWVQS
jgi:hypothetical protein